MKRLHTFHSYSSQISKSYVQNSDKHAEHFKKMTAHDMFVRQICKWAATTSRPDPLFDILAAMPITTLTDFERLLLSQIIDCMTDGYSMPSQQCTSNISLKERMQLSLAWLKAASKPMALGNPEASQMDVMVTLGGEMVASEIFGVELEKMSHTSHS